MKEFFKLLLVVVIVTLPLAGCFKSPEEKAAEEAAEQMAEVLGDLGQIDGLEDLAEMDEEDLANSFGKMMEIGAEMEMQEFESQKSLDLPNGFPMDLVYTNSKVTGVSNSSSGDDLYLDVDLRSTDNADAIKAFYAEKIKNNSDWTVDNESMDTGYYTLTASQDTDNQSQDIDVTIYYNDYSSLTDINLYYTSYSY